jgi:hypothetical protein
MMRRAGQVSCIGEMRNAVERSNGKIQVKIRGYY